MDLKAIGPFMVSNWPLLLPVALGFAAVYLLLPRARRDLLLPGVLVGAAALLAGGWFLVQREFATVEAVLFYAFSAIALLGAGLMLAQTNPVRAALSFALVILATCGLFLLLAAPFLMAATLVIYGGAIIITFLFVVMLAQQSGLTSADERSREPFLASLAGFVLLGCLLVVLQKNYDTRQFDQEFGLVYKNLERVSRASSIKEMKAIRDEPVIDGEGLVYAIDHLKEKAKSFPTKLEPHNLEDPAVPAEEVKKLCRKLMAEILALRNSKGSLRVTDQKLEMNPSAPALPGRNVEAMGLALFTDYLVGVEMAGMLLTVATIGAIVVVQRRRPGARESEVLR